MRTAIVKHLALTSMAILILATIPMLSAYGSQEQVNQTDNQEQVSKPASQDQVRARVVIQVAELARMHVQTLTDVALRHNTSTAQAEGLVAEADQKLTEAKAALEAGNYVGAIIAAKDAQTRYRMAGLALARALGSYAEETDEAAVGMLAAIQRAEDRIERVREILERAPSLSNELKVQVEGNLTKAESYLEDAKQLAEAYIEAVKDGQAPSTLNLEVAEENLRLANEYVSQAFQALKEVGHWNGVRLIQGFAKGLLNHLDRIEVFLDRAERRGADVTKLRENLGEATILVKNAQDMLSQGDYEQALKDLRDAGRLIIEIHAELLKPLHMQVGRL